MIIVGHRGARNEAPENTVSGFEHAQANGCIHFELDIQLSKDHQLMVFHDTNLKRTTGKRGRMSDFTAAELGKLDARRNTPGWPTFCGIPSLQEVIDASPFAQSWQFEVKTDSRRRLTALARILTHFICDNKLEDSAIITSSDRWFLAHLQNKYSSFRRGYVAEYAIPSPVSTALRLGCRYLCCYYKLASPERIQQAHQQGLHVSCWTVNAMKDIEQLIDFGVDSIITDTPSLLLKKIETGFGT